jgi:hypothetical protein
MKVVVTGATGFVGQVIVKKLLASGHEVVVLTRNVAKAAILLGNDCKYFQWNDSHSVPPVEALEGTDGVINLMGETISKRWDEQQKKKIYHSRIDGTRRLVEAIEKLSKKPKVFVSTSAVGIYGNRDSEEVTESSSLANDFLANVCKDWENEANKAKNHGMRVVIVRVGVVLGKGSAALSKMLPVFKLGAGGPVGSGKQYMSWIHVEDLANIYIEALNDSTYQGVYNGTSPNPATNKDFSHTLGRVLSRPAFAPAPGFMMKLIFGEMSQILLEGQKVLPKKIREKNFRFRYPTLEMALTESVR